MELVFLRHGETDENCKGKYLGKTDVPLNEKGRLQAREAGRLLAGQQFDAAFVSPMLRTRETALLALEGREVPFFWDDRLKERNFGVFDNHTYQEIHARFPSEAKQWDQEWKTYQIPEGESAQESYDRNAAVIDEIAQTRMSKVLVVSHLGAIRNMLSYLLGFGLEQVWRFRVENGRCAALKEKEGFWFLTF